MGKLPPKPIDDINDTIGDFMAKSIKFHILFIISFFIIYWCIVSYILL